MWFRLFATLIACWPLWPSDLTIVSINLAEETDVDRIMKELDRIGQVRHADVFLLQEVRRYTNDESAMPHALARALDMHCAFAPGDRMDDGSSRGVAILSRYPLSAPAVIQLQRHRLKFKNRQRVALGVTVATPAGPVRIFNLHLDNRVNSRQKSEQLIPVVKAAAGFAGPRIIGGDFNTGDIYWVGHLMPVPYLQRQSRTVRDLMTSSGYSDPFERFGSTFDFFSLRLDWIWLQDLSAASSGVEPLRFSDHHALWVKLQPPVQTAAGQAQ